MVGSIFVYTFYKNFYRKFYLSEGIINLTVKYTITVESFDSFDTYSFRSWWLKECTLEKIAACSINCSRVGFFFIGMYTMCRCAL